MSLDENDDDGKICLVSRIYFVNYFHICSVFCFMSVIVLVQEQQSASNSWEGVLLSTCRQQTNPKNNENNLVNFTFDVFMKYYFLE